MIVTRDDISLGPAAAEVASINGLEADENSF